MGFGFEPPSAHCIIASVNVECLATNMRAARVAAGHWGNGPALPAVANFVVAA